MTKKKTSHKILIISFQWEETMSDLEEAKRSVNYTITKDDFLAEISQLIDDLFAVIIN